MKQSCNKSPPPIYTSGHTHMQPSSSLRMSRNKNGSYILRPVHCHLEAANCFDQECCLDFGDKLEKILDILLERCQNLLKPSSGPGSLRTRGPPIVAYARGCSSNRKASIPLTLSFNFVLFPLASLFLFFQQAGPGGPGRPQPPRIRRGPPARGYCRRLQGEYLFL